MSAGNTNTNPTRCRSYADHRQFVLKKLNHATCPHGRDFPPDERRCCICHEDIHDNSTVAQVCPQSPKHIYHWLCMIQWVNTWNDEAEEHNRGCPTCRAEMLTVNEAEYSRHHPLPEPDERVVRQRQLLAAGWDIVLAARSTMVSSSDGGYVLPPLDDNTVDRALPIRYAMMGEQGSSRDLAVALMALADPLQIEVMRSAAYMTDNPDQLNGLLNFVDELRFSFEAVDPPVRNPEVTPRATPQATPQASQAPPQTALQAAPQTTPQAAPQPVSATHQMEAQHMSGVEDEYATQEEGEELKEDEGEEGEDDDGDEEEPSKGETLVDGSEDGQGDTDDTDGEMTLLQETQDTDPEKPPSPERDSQMEEQDSQMEDQDSQMEEYDSEEYDSQEHSDDQEMSDPDEEDKSPEIFMSDAVEQIRDEEEFQGSPSPEWENVI
ncbi:hypothetical protein SLS58_002931 [Diplodia intermedia]|uniref:RING-type domain-containing protein n=1 Tax=Diplodia intermedia TaxID=856260 RepID=A0ABR3TY16_9PEZI